MALTIPPLYHIFQCAVDSLWKIDWDNKLESTPAPHRSVTIFASEYIDFLQFWAAKQPALPVIVVKSGNPVAFFSQFSSLGPWILDSGASGHMTSNQFLFPLNCLFHTHCLM